MTLGAVGQGMVAGDLVNTASRLQSRRGARDRAGRRGDPARRIERDRLRAGRRAARSRARTLPVSAWRAVRVVAQARGRGSQRPARGAVRRPRRGAAPAQGPLPRHRTRAARATCLDHGPGGHRQEPARLGVPEVRRRGRRGRLLARGRSPAYGEGVTFWALGEMVRCRAGLLETDDPSDDPREGRRDGREHVPDEDGATLDRARAARPARCRRGSGRRARRAVPRLAHVLRAHRRRPGS